MIRDLNTADHIANGFARLASFLRHSDWRNAEPNGLTPTQAHILTYLKARGPQRVTALADELAVTQPTVSDAVSALQRKGLIDKRRDSLDRRALRVHLTGRGMELAAKVERADPILLEAIGDLKPADRTALLKSLTGLVHILQARGAIPVQRMCVSCRYFRPNAHSDRALPHHCDFVDAAFGDDALRLDCGDHEAAPPEQTSAAWRRFRETAM